MDKLKIIKKAPIPPSGWVDKKTRNPMRIAASQMQIGDAVDLPSIGHASRMVGCLKDAGYKATMRKLDDGTFRVWRVDPDYDHAENGVPKAKRSRKRA